MRELALDVIFNSLLFGELFALRLSACLRTAPVSPSRLADNTQRLDRKKILPQFAATVFVRPRLFQTRTTFLDMEARAGFEPANDGFEAKWPRGRNGGRAGPDFPQ